MTRRSNYAGTSEKGHPSAVNHNTERTYEMTTPELSRSARLYQERREPDHRVTRRRPNTHIDVGRNAAHTVTMSPPYPLPEVLQGEDMQPPDGGASKVWPWGYTEEEIV